MKISLTIAAFAVLFPSAIVAKGGPPHKDPPGGTKETVPDDFEAPDLDGVEDAIYSYKCGTEIFVCGIKDNDAEIHQDFYENHLCGTSKQTGTVTYFTTDVNGRDYETYCAETRQAMMDAEDDQNAQKDVRCPTGKEMR
ncbi:MAG: hypothetical protein SGARI_007347 [Bacillariaceae sp.]